MFDVIFVKGDISPRYDTKNKKVIYGDQKGTLSDWGLIPATRPVVPLPEPKTNWVEIDSVNGTGIDLSEAYTGYPLYKNREFEFKFYRQKSTNWPTDFQKIFTWLHGQKVKMILDYDPTWYYEGRVWISEAKSDKYWSILTIKGDMYPYKKYVYRSDAYDEIIWDLINFEEGLEANSNAYTYEGEAKEITIPSSGAPINIRIHVIENGQMDPKKEGNKYYINGKFTFSNRSETFVIQPSVYYSPNLSGVVVPVRLITYAGFYDPYQLRYPPGKDGVLIVSSTQGYEHPYLYFEVLYRKESL